MVFFLLFLATLKSFYDVFWMLILLNSMVDHQGLTDFLHVKGEDNEFQGEEVQEQSPLVLISIHTTFAAQPSCISSFNQRACKMIL